MVLIRRLKVPVLIKLSIVLFEVTMGQFDDQMLLVGQ